MDKFSLQHCVFLASILAGDEPQSFKEAMAYTGWCVDMHKEIQALEDNHTWVMGPLPSGKRALVCRWVYQFKYHVDGTVESL